MKQTKFVYLVQGQASYIKDFFYLGERPNCRAIYLTYDKKIKNAIYYPESSWAEGRNKLLEYVHDNISHYEYIIFFDDDVSFYKGNISQFESEIWSYKPKIAVPIVDRTIPYSLPLLRVQGFSFCDQQIMAVRKDVVEERKILPYDLTFDDDSWYMTCRIQLHIIQSIYQDESLQINSIFVRNKLETRYNQTLWNEESAKIAYEHSKSIYKKVEKIDTDPTFYKLIKITVIYFYKNFNKIIITPLIFEYKLFVIQFWTRFFLINIDKYKLLNKIINKNKKLVIYGFSESGINIYNFIKDAHQIHKISNICDRLKATGKIDGITITDPSSIDICENTIIIATSKSIKTCNLAHLYFTTKLKIRNFYYLK